MINAEEIRAIVKEIEARPGIWRQVDWVEADVSVYDYRKPQERRGLFPLKRGAHYVSIGDFRQVGIDAGFCGTRACIAGHAVLRAGYTVGLESPVVYDEEGKVIGQVDTVAQNLLGLTDEQATALFAGSTGRDRNYAHSVRTLKADITEITGVTFDE